MKDLVFDASALISYLDGEDNAENVADLLEEINVKGLTAYLCVVNLGEIFYHFLRTAGEKTALTALSAIKTLPIEIIDANLELTLEAASIKAFHKLSYADAFAASLALLKKAMLVTGDREFKQLESKIKINWI